MEPTHRDERADDRRSDDLGAWWGDLSGEERMRVMDCVRLEETEGLSLVAAAHPAPIDLVSGRLPAQPLSDFVRRRPEYLERYALADITARRDDTGIGLPTVPEAHERTAPILEQS